MAMELTPELLLEAKFGAARRGYDMAEVDDFLERCAEGLDVLLSRLRSEFERAEQAEAENAALRRRLDDPDADFARPAPAPAAVDEPVPVAAPAPEPEVGEPMRILIAAERTAEAAIADARAEAERIRSEAEAIASTQRSEAESLLARAKADAEAEARRAGDEARRAVQSEVVALRRDRDSLNDDIRMLRRWLDDQRTRLRTAARDMQRIAEDPGALRELPLPETTSLDGVEPTDESEGPAPGDAGAELAGPDAGPDTDDEIVDVADGAFDDGEPTEAVPVLGDLRPFDAERADEEHAEHLS